MSMAKRQMVEDTSDVRYKERVRAELVSRYGGDWVRKYWERFPDEFLQDGEDIPDEVLYSRTPRKGQGVAYPNMASRLYYEGSDMHVLGAIDRADRIKRRVVWLASLRAVAIVRGDMADRDLLTQYIERAYSGWKEAVGTACRRMQQEVDGGFTCRPAKARRNRCGY